MRRAVIWTVVFWLSASAALANGRSILLVHLPSAPVENAGELAEAVEHMASGLSAALPEVTLETEVFRRYGDAASYFRANIGQILLVLSEPAFFHDLPAPGWEPSYRLEPGGESPPRLVLVVPSARQELARLGDLSGSALSVSERAGESFPTYLARAVFGGTLEPASFFERLERAADDATAVADVLFSRTDAALVAENAPLLAEHLGKDLRVLFQGPEVAAPVLVGPGDAWGAAQRTALGSALQSFAAATEGRASLRTLGGISFTPITEGSAPLLKTPEAEQRVLETALPPPGVIQLEGLLPAPPGAEELPFYFELEVPDLPPLSADPNETLDG